MFLIKRRTYEQTEFKIELNPLLNHIIRFWGGFVGSQTNFKFQRKIDDFCVPIYHSVQIHSLK